MAVLDEVSDNGDKVTLELSVEVTLLSLIGLPLILLVDGTDKVLLEVITVVVGADKGLLSLLALTDNELLSTVVVDPADDKGLELLIRPSEAVTDKVLAMLDPLVLSVPLVLLPPGKIGGVGMDSPPVPGGVNGGTGTIPSGPTLNTNGGFTV